MEQARATIALLDDLKSRIRRLSQQAKAADRAVIPFGIGAVDTRLPGGGLALGALHELSGGGPDVEHGASAALLIAGVLARHSGQVLWVVERADLFAPALDAVGLSPDRVIYAEGRRFWLYRNGDAVDAATGDLRWFLHGIF
jgi:protein ImuA